MHEGLGGDDAAGGAVLPAFVSIMGHAKGAEGQEHGRWRARTDVGLHMYFVSVAVMGVALRI